MNIGDGLLFELENGKPKLILLSHGAEKNAAKQPSFRPRAANILSSRQPSCIEDVQGEERRPRQPAGRQQEAGSKARRAAASFSSNTTEGRSTTLTSCKTNDHHKGGSSKVVAKVKPDRHKHSGTVGPLRVDGKAGATRNVRPRGGGKASLDAGLKENLVCLTSEQLQQILSTVQTSSSGPLLPGGNDGLTAAVPHRAPQDPNFTSFSLSGNQTQNSKSGPSMTEGGGGEMKEEDIGRGGETQKGGGEAETQEKDRRLSGCLFSWMEDRESDSRVAIDAKKAQWKKELDEQVALKQQCLAPARLQEEDADSVLSVQSCVSHREQPAAIRSSLRLGEVTPMEDVLSVERKEEQRRRWLEELDHQREEATERRRREKLQQSQAENAAFWAAHSDSLQRRPPIHPAAPSAPSAPTPAPFSSSERGELDPSSLSLVWDAMSSCGPESVGRVSVDPVSGFPTRPSYLRTMTSLLDPAQIEEKERRRLKQLEQQRAIQAQMEERRQQRERDQAKRKQEEEAEENRVMLEREMLQRQYEMDTLRERQKEQPAHPAEQPKKGHDDGELEESSATQQVEGLKDSSVAYKDSAVQTDAVLSLLTADRVETPDVSAQYQLSSPPLPPPPLPPPTAPPNSKSRAVRTGKENICVPSGGDPYEAFARRDKKRPEWNTQRPSRRFVPASQRYPAALQKNRQESRLKRQAELLALQERTCLSRTDPPAQNQDSGPSQSRTSPARKVENGSSSQSSSTAVNPERGRSPPVPAVRHRAGSRQASSPPPPPPVLEFVPYVRTDEVFNLDPLEPADTPPPHPHTGAPPAAPQRDLLLHPELLRSSHTHRQQEILRGLAQLRQGLLQKQRELETDLNPLLKLHDNGRWSPSTTHRT